MKSLQVLLAVCLATTSAFAVIDPDPDMMGIYFDLNADENCLTIGSNEPYNAYLILTNPTSSGISAYEFGLEIVVPGGMENLIFRLGSFAGNAPSPGWVDKTGFLGGDYIVGLGYIIPAAPATILHRWNYMVLDVIPVEMYIHSASTPSIPGDLPIVLTDEGNLMQVGLSTGGPDIPVATVNTDCVVGVEGVSFGGVKALFR